MMDVRSNQMYRGGRAPTLSLTAREKVIAAKYSPFRDPEPANYLICNHHVNPPTVRIYRKRVGDKVIEWRGHIPVGVNNYKPDVILEVRK